MEIDLTKGKPKYVEAIYTCHLGFDLNDLEIDWTKVESLWCKYGELTIIMKDGTEHNVRYSTEGEIDYKWPIELRLLNWNYDILWEE